MLKHTYSVTLAQVETLIKLANSFRNVNCTALFMLGLLTLANLTLILAIKAYCSYQVRLYLQTS